MLNFRKLKQDFSSSILKQGKDLYDQKKVLSAKILSLDQNSIRISGQILGNYENAYESEFEIDRFESQAVHSNCDCPYQYDCQHLAALIFYLEEHINSILIAYSNEANIKESSFLDAGQKKELLQKINEAKNKEVKKKDAEYQKQVLQEYKEASHILATHHSFCRKKIIG